VLCWIAERAGASVGAVFLVRESDGVAKLRMLCVKPDTHGLGIGTRLVSESSLRHRPAAIAGWSRGANDVLHEARRIYQRAGFRLVCEEHHHSFGKDLVGQYWELEL
jgi:ribosomal protein S18 acetylase RimI-like enzyme